MLRRGEAMYKRLIAIRSPKGILPSIFTRSLPMSASSLLAVILSALAAPADLPTVKITADDTVISKSCRIEIAPDTVIEDKNGDGVIHIGASNIEIVFADGSVLRGSPKDRRPDEYKGYGIRLNGHTDVTIRNARVSGYWCGLWATKADKLVLDGVDASDNRRQNLKSTPTAEDGADWLFPHHNDERSWRDEFGAGICIDASDSVTVHDCRVQHGQNGLIIDHVTNSKIYDNDFSFDSGWGIAMWQSSKNVISRNAIDFCVRGYSHNVYNRGQDSAGILIFEQNNENVIAENSATHGGDCVFGFAGREAIAEIGKHPVEWYKRRGNTDNLLIGNDLSYAPAHGIEMTFSHGNKFIGNRLVGNAICGVWGGYSQDTLIAGNLFQDNGEMGYGLERGGVNIEHGKQNRIVHNKFQNNKCGVHLWWGPNPDFEKKPWGQANGAESTDNLIAANEFRGDALAFHFRGKSDVTLGKNSFQNVTKEMTADPAVKVLRDDARVGEPKIPEHAVYGNKHPVGARPALRGRENIIMTEWGPWDHEAPLIRQVPASTAAAIYELHKLPKDAKVNLDAGQLKRSFVGGEPGRVMFEAETPGVYQYSASIDGNNFHQEIHGTLVSTLWDTTFFKWTKAVDPREHLEEYHKLAAGPSAVSVKLSQIDLKYGGRGPSDMHLSKQVDDAKIGRDYFGMIATTKLPLTKGKWQLKTISDDGVRVTVDGKPVIDNWKWHGAETNTATLELPADKTVEIVVEHFEIDGAAVMEFQLTQQ
jgi:parallel beta-helix repeat protein